MNGRILRALLVLAVALLLPAASALASPLETSTYGVACASAADCVATGQLPSDSGFALQFHTGAWSTTPTMEDVSPAFCSPVACIIPPAVWGGTWQSESGGAFETISSPKLPSNASTADGATELVGSCTWPNDCTFAAHYTVKGGTHNTVFLTLVNGKWKADAEPSKPPGPNTGAEHDVMIGSIACSKPGDCSAAGYYAYSHSRERNLLLTESNGKWGHDVTANLPAAQAAPTIPARIACGATPYCIATGATGVSIETPTAKNIYGVWKSKKVSAALKPDAVACSITGNCVIGGGSSSQGTILEQANGAWKALFTVPGTGGPFTQVTCPYVGDCVAISDNLIESELNGVWTTVPALTPPMDASGTPEMQLGSVACQSAGYCFAVGTFQNAADQTAEFLVTETDGVWSSTATDFPAS